MCGLSLVGGYTKEWSGEYAHALHSGGEGDRGGPSFG